MTFSHPQDSLRWQRILQGDTHEFAEFVDQHKNLITSVAYSAIGDLSGSEDIAQETFLVAWQSRHDLQDPNKLVGWLCAVARNLARQWIRQHSSKSWPTTNLDSSCLEQNAPHPSERLVTEEEESLVWNALEAIPESYREVMVLYYRESQSIAEVASALEITEEAARQRLSRGRNRLRAEVERTIEAALAKTQPTAHFTAGVIAIINSAGWSSAAGKAAVAATAGWIGKTASGSSLVAATQTAATGAMLGAAGGAIGTLGGLGGTWLGIRVPQLLAPTMTERQLLEREGRFVWRFSLLYTFAILLAVGLPFLLGLGPNVLLYVLPVTMLMTFCFTGTCIVRGIRVNRTIQRIRQEISPEQDPNPTWLKERLGVNGEGTQSLWIGRRVTSKSTFWGWPLYDFQVSDPVNVQKKSAPLHAKGWLAVGDGATGFLAIGNVATGIIAIGGRSIGLISCGGVSFGLFSFGGLALGILSIGGFSMGHSAIGGGAVGWRAVGGGAVGVYSANGGLAISGHMAEGGQAIALKYAVGGSAIAPEANTEIAKQECEKSWVSDYLGTRAIIENPQAFRRNTLIYGTALPVGFAVLFAIAIPALMYRRNHQKGLEE